ISRALITIEKIKKERSASVRSQVVTSYMIYFVFIFILVVMQMFIILPLSQQSATGLTESITGGGVISGKMFSDVFVVFIIIQGFFAGLVTGKISEGTLISGLKHSVILILLGYAIFSFATQFQVFFA
ncbi:MAG: hypothetical protein DRP16_03835, partial [Candidatus Aenigmatarchaeota archaeon]